MKNISNYDAEKYKNEKYFKEADGIYKVKNEFVTSLIFEQEPKLGEGDSPINISQYPLEDILDKFCTYISDFYEELNKNSHTTCYYEFASSDIENIKNLRSVIGKHVYNITKNIDGTEYEELIIE
ncbi:MAG: hypothetical protein N4A48_12610 [Tepidibacter sp.]|jgi:hypothetical protein|uniref:hypothetical protein n=1 Tax=Tepidibacter sp. TaxID=2529387 RepID=UPI0025E26593|nr:hypothetical protein [Tepidibacter sp.]MCT4509570.1 hypothetical protein [Tepidibacter sp.]